MDLSAACPGLSLPTQQRLARRITQQRTAPALNGLARRQLTCKAAGKGFGPGKPAKNKGNDSKGRRQDGRVQTVEVQRPQPPPNMGTVPQLQQEEVPMGPTAEDEEFARRLAQLKEEGRERADAVRASAQVPSTAASKAPAAASPAVFDNDIYANPPSLVQTLSGPRSDISDPKLRDANIGPSQVGLAVGAVVFVAAFVVVAAGDYAPASKRYAGVRPAQVPPDPIQEKMLRGKVTLYEERLKTNPNDQDALEALASTNAKLFEFDKAVPQLEKLTKLQPDNADAWRLLGEAALLNTQPGKAVPALERAVELRRAATPGGALRDGQLLTGLVDAYIAASSYAKAIDLLEGVRAQVQQDVVQAAAAAAATQQPAVSAAAAAAPSAPSSSELVEAGTLEAPPLMGDAPSAAAADDAASTSTASALAEAPSTSLPSPSAPAPAPAPRPLDPVGVELLAAKVYSAWRGHDNDALATYDGLIRSQPEDFRGYLAKGVFLKEKGRRADAERMFMQARFYAPASKQALVQGLAAQEPLRPLPDN